MRTFAKGFDSDPAAGGKTAGNYDKIGTITAPNKEFEIYAYGILLGISPQAVTAGESGAPEVEFNSTELGLNKERWDLPEFGMTDPIGTNSQFICKDSEIILLDIDKPINGKKLDIGLSSNATMTADWDMQASIIFGDLPPGSLPDDYVRELKNNFTSQRHGRKRIEQDAALAVAAADTDVSLAAIELFGIDAEILGLGGHIIPNAPTAGEEHCARISYRSGDLDLAPQEFPASFSAYPTIGTVVGGAAPFRGRTYPARFKLPEKGFSLDVFAQNVIAITNAPDFMQSVLVRTI